MPQTIFRNNKPQTRVVTAQELGIRPDKSNAAAVAKRLTNNFTAAAVKAGRDGIDASEVPALRALAQKAAAATGLAMPVNKDLQQISSSDYFDVRADKAGASKYIHISAWFDGTIGRTPPAPSGPATFAARQAIDPQNPNYMIQPGDTLEEISRAQLRGQLKNLSMSEFGSLFGRPGSANADSKKTGWMSTPAGAKFDELFARHASEPEKAFAEFTKTREFAQYCAEPWISAHAGKVRQVQDLLVAANPSITDPNVIFANTNLKTVGPAALAAVLADS